MSSPVRVLRSLQGQRTLSQPHTSPPSTVTMCGTNTPSPDGIEDLTPEERAARGADIIEYAIKDVCAAAAGGRVMRSVINNLSFLGFELSTAQVASLSQVMQRGANAGSLEKKNLSRNARTIADDIIRGVLDGRT